MRNLAGGFTVRRRGRFIWCVPFRAILQPCSITLECPHAVVGTGLERRSDFEKLACANEVFNSEIAHEHYSFGHAHIEVGPKNEPLRNYPNKAISQLCADGGLDFCRERGGNSLQRFGAGGGMNSCQYKMSSF
jgi:hypothetical protein